MTEEQLRFHLEEYKVLRAEIAAYVKYTFDFFLYAAVASGGIAAWLLTHQADLAAIGAGAARVIAFIPFAIALLAYVAVLHLIFIVERTARYCSKVETAVAAPGLGWETQNRSSQHATIPLVTWLTQNASWLVLIAGDLVLGLTL